MFLFLLVYVGILVAFYSRREEKPGIVFYTIHGLLLFAVVCSLLTPDPTYEQIAAHKEKREREERREKERKYLEDLHEAAKLIDERR